MCVSRNVYKMVSYTPTLLKNSLRGLGEKAFSLQRGRGEKNCVTKMKFRSSARPDLRITRGAMAAAFETFKRILA